MVHTTGEPLLAARYLDHLAESDIVKRLWAEDFTVWGPRPDDIANRLGWLRAPERMAAHVPSLRAFAGRVHDEGYAAVVLLGMGGSSLAPETLAQTARAPAVPLTVLDTLHPAAVQRALETLDVSNTLFIVSTKSGTTSETLSLFRVFHARAVAELGHAAAGRRFVAITDPGSPLADLAARERFRTVFLNDPQVGGRYAALTLVGLVPAALLGLDLEALLASGRDAAAQCGPGVPLARNPAARLASVLAACATEGRDKVTFVVPPRLASFGDWVEQLLAESTGKSGRGLVPVVGEPLGAPDAYGDDRVFVRLGAAAAPLAPHIDVDFAGPEALGGQFFLWEMATALVGHLLGVNPFDQPDVESAKRLTRALLEAYAASGERPAGPVVPLTAEAMRVTLAQARDGDYVALLAFLDPASDAGPRLATLRERIRGATRCATTLGFGPRYLHSTGQLHKGDAGRGLFLMLVDDPVADVAVRGDRARPLRCGVLLRAQALADAAALAERGRRRLLADTGPNSADAIGRALAP